MRYLAFTPLWRFRNPGNLYVARRELRLGIYQKYQTACLAICGEGTLYLQTCPPPTLASEKLRLRVQE